MYTWIKNLSDAALAAALTAATTAYTALNTGSSVLETVDQNGERVSFGRVDRRSLLAYMDQLQAEISRRAVGAAQRHAPLGFTF